MGPRVHCDLFRRGGQEGRKTSQEGSEEVWQNTIEKFEKEVKEQQQFEWNKDEASTKYQRLIDTKESFRTEEEVDRALANLHN